MDEKFCGTWVSEKNENYDEFLKAMGLSFPVRTVAKTLTTTLVIQSLGDKKYKVISSTGPKTRETEFTIGEEVEDTSNSGQQMKGKWEIEGENMLGVFVNVKTGVELTIHRSMVDGQMVQNMKIGPIECIRHFKRK